MWVEELMGNLWDLNCLVYSGVLVARKLGEEEEDKETDVVMAEECWTPMRWR